MAFDENDDCWRRFVIKNFGFCGKLSHSRARVPRVERSGVEGVDFLPLKLSKTDFGFWKKKWFHSSTNKSLKPLIETSLSFIFFIESNQNPKSKIN